MGSLASSPARDRPSRGGVTPLRTLPRWQSDGFPLARATAPQSAFGREHPALRWRGGDSVDLRARIRGVPLRDRDRAHDPRDARAAHGGACAPGGGPAAEPRSREGPRARRPPRAARATSDPRSPCAPLGGRVRASDRGARRARHSDARPRARDRGDRHQARVSSLRGASRRGEGALRPSS